MADTPWRHRRVEGGGVSLDVGVHRFDLVRALAGEIRDIQARTAVVEPVRWGHDEQGRLTQRVECDAEDTVYASFATAAGMTGELTASWAGRGGGTMPGTGDVYYASGGRVCGDEVIFEKEKRGQDSFLAYPEKSPAPFFFRGCSGKPKDPPGEPAGFGGGRAGADVVGKPNDPPGEPAGLTGKLVAQCQAE